MMDFEKHFAKANWRDVWQKKKNQHQLKGGKASRGQLAGDQVMVKFDVPVRGNKIFNQKRKIKNK